MPRSVQHELSPPDRAAQLAMNAFLTPVKVAPPSRLMAWHRHLEDVGAGAARQYSLTWGEEDDDAANPQLQPVPGAFECPITNEIMVDPVLTSDGRCYEHNDMALFT